MRCVTVYRRGSAGFALVQGIHFVDVYWVWPLQRDGSHTDGTGAGAIAIRTELQLLNTRDYSSIVA